MIGAPEAWRDPHLGSRLATGDQDKFIAASLFKSTYWDAFED